MNTEFFDGVVREMGEVSTRRTFFRLVSGAAALTAGLALGGSSLARGKSHSRARNKTLGKNTATAERRGNNGQRITICYQNQTRSVKKKGFRTKFPGATVGVCPPIQKPQTACTSWILSGGADPNTNIQVDDDLQVMVNGVAVINDTDKKASSLAPAKFTANIGDSLGITAFDSNPACRSLSPLWLHCATTGQKRQLFAGKNDGCAAGRTPGNFVTEVFQISL